MTLSLTLTHEKTARCPKGSGVEIPPPNLTNLTAVQLWKRPHLPKPWCLFYKTGIEACISKGRGDVCCRLLHDPQFTSFAVIKHCDQKQLEEGRVYFILHFHITVFYRGKSGQELTAGTGRQELNLVCGGVLLIGLLLMAYSVGFLM